MTRSPPQPACVEKRDTTAAVFRQGLALRGAHDAEQQASREGGAMPLSVLSSRRHRRRHDDSSKYNILPLSGKTRHAKGFFFFFYFSLAVFYLFTNCSRFNAFVITVVMCPDNIQSTPSPSNYCYEIVEIRTYTHI